MFKNIMDDTQLQKRIFEENVKDKFGESISNDLFRDNAKYFRDCLVLANYSQLNRYNEFIKPDIKPLYRFFEKFVIDDKLELIEIEPVHNNKYYDKIENPSKLLEYEGLNEDLFGLVEFF